MEELVKLASDQQNTIKALTEELDSVTKLAEAAAEEAANQRELAEKAGSVIAEEVDKALESNSSEAVSDEMKDELVETVAKLDPDLASDLTDAFAKADMQDEKIDGEKLGSIIKHTVLDKLSVTRSAYSDSRQVRSDKTASRRDSNNANAALEARYEEKLATVLGRRV